MPDDTDPNVIRGFDLLYEHGIDPLKIANWITSRKIRIVGLLDDPRKEHPKCMMLSEVDESEKDDQISVEDLKHLAQKLIERLTILYSFWRYEHLKNSDAQKISKNTEEIKNIINFFIFEKTGLDQLVIDDSQSANEVENLVSIHDLILKLHIDIIVVADLLVTGRIQIASFGPTSLFYDPPNMESLKLKKRVQQIINDLKILLLSRNYLQGSLEFDGRILEIIEDCCFYEKEITEAYLQAHNEVDAGSTSTSNIKVTRWEDITFEIKTDELVSVKTPTGKKRSHYSELGFADGRSKDRPNKTTWPLFLIFAKFDGEISPQNPYPGRNLSDKARHLNKHLKEIFGIKDSIFIDSHYKKNRRYKTKFAISDHRSR